MLQQRPKRKLKKNKTGDSEREGEALEAHGDRSGELRPQVAREASDLQPLLYSENGGLRAKHWKRTAIDPVS